MQCGLEEKDDWSVELAVGIELDLDGWDIVGFLSLLQFGAQQRQHFKSMLFLSI